MVELSPLSNKRACAETWRLNRSGPHGTEAGSCPSGCATGNSVLPPQSPNARDRGHLQLDKIPREIGATRLYKQNDCGNF